MNLQVVLQAIYNSGAEATAAIRDEWGLGWQVRLDENTEPLADDLEAAAQWLHERALQSRFKSQYAAAFNAVAHAPRAQPDLSDALEAFYTAEDRIGIRSVAGKGWDVTLNQTVVRVSSLEQAAQWLTERAAK